MPTVQKRSVPRCLSGGDLLVLLNSYKYHHIIKDNVIRPAHLRRGDEVVKVTQFQCSTERRHLLTSTEFSYFAESALTSAPPNPYQLRLPDVIHDYSPIPYLAVDPCPRSKTLKCERCPSSVSVTRLLTFFVQVSVLVG